MKRVGFILMLLLATLTASAQRGNGDQRAENNSNSKKMSPEERHEEELEKLTQMLVLSAEQVDEIAKVQSTFIVSIEEMREGIGEDTNRKKIREEMTVLRGKYNKDVEALLDDEQKVKYAAHLKKQDEKMQENQSQGKGGKRGSGGGQRPS